MQGWNCFHCCTLLEIHGVYEIVKFRSLPFIKSVNCARKLVYTREEFSVLNLDVYCHTSLPPQNRMSFVNDRFCLGIKLKHNRY